MSGGDGALVSPDWLQARLGDPTVRVLEASVERQTYEGAHIPGAVWVSAHADLLLEGDADTSGYVITPGQFSALMQRLSIAPETTVVWYGDRHDALAIRGFWTMDYYVHPGGCHVLDGGRERWIAEGRPMTRDIISPPAASYPRPEYHDASNRASIEQVRDAIGDPGAVLLDVRAVGEYDGTTVRARRSGHIPGATHIEWTDATDGDNVLKPPGELRTMYEAAGVTPDKDVIAHCQLGVRAAHTWFVLKHVLGYPNVRNYDGSWVEWGNRDDTPIE